MGYKSLVLKESLSADLYLDIIDNEEFSLLCHEKKIENLFGEKVWQDHDLGRVLI